MLSRERPRLSNPDARSRGGTQVNGAAIAQGVSRALRSGDRVRFGQVELLFLLSREFFKMGKFLAGFVR